jgi:hypothetical protein
MSTRNPLSLVARAALAATCVITSVSCGGELLRTGRSPVYLVITGIAATAGSSGEESSFLLSDVSTDDGAVFNDSVEISLRADAKNTTLPTTSLNDVTMTRYRVVYRRSDGRNNQGSDVPYSFEGGLSTTVPAGNTGAVVFNLVRHQAKLEPPLRNMRGLGGLAILTTVAEITLWGRDQNGNELMVQGFIDVTFADFPDDEQ